MIQILHLAQDMWITQYVTLTLKESTRQGSTVKNRNIGEKSELMEQKEITYNTSDMQMSLHIFSWAAESKY